VIGPLVAVTLLPRFSSFVGDGEFATAPLDVEAFESLTVTFWRGPLVGGAVSSPFATHFEQSHDALNWTAASGTITTANAVSNLSMPFTKRWFRVRVVLDADLNGVVAISMWLTGALRRRVPQGA
jgi:hypothetical protein